MKETQEQNSPESDRSETVALRVVFAMAQGISRAVDLGVSAVPSRVRKPIREYWEERHPRRTESLEEFVSHAKANNVLGITVNTWYKSSEDYVAPGPSLIGGVGRFTTSAAFTDFRTEGTRFKAVHRQRHETENEPDYRRRFLRDVITAEEERTRIQDLVPEIPVHIFYSESVVNEARESGIQPYKRAE